MLGRDLQTRIKFSPLGKVVEAGKLQGQALIAYRKMKPLMAHVDDDHCPHCTVLFSNIKNCPAILALPDGSFKEANEHIISCPSCSANMRKILQCPIYKEKNNHGPRQK